MLALVFAALSVNAPVSSVTLYGDRARVVRTAEVAINGSQQLELPMLPIRVDPDSIRLEATGAEVRQVEIERVEREDYPLDEARALLARLDKLDDDLAQVADERAQLASHLEELGKIEPGVEDEPFKPRPRLDAKRWDEVLSFSLAQEEAAQERIRKLDARADELRREREPLWEKASKLGNRFSNGFRVTASLSGRGTAHLKLSYLVSGARWIPGYDLRLEPDQKSVRVAFSGTASQSTGEDWDGVRMTLSTALPATARALPEIATWKIGERERFIPTPVRADRPGPRPLPVEPQPETPVQSEELLLRSELIKRAPERTFAGLTDQKEESAQNKLAITGTRRRRKDLAEPSPAAEPAPSAPPAPSKRASDESAVDKSQIASSGPASIGDFLQQVPQESEGQLALAPPVSIRPPQPPPDSPSALAGGFDLRFDSPGRESLHDGEGARRVPLFSETWPVTAERLIEPGLSPDTYLVARLKNPSERTLPRGQAALTVGDDAAGSATVPLVAPGQELTLPLGVDRAVRSFRNVAVVQTEKGLFSKDDVSRYAVTIEVQNPYAVPIALRIVDQLPLPGDKNVEVELIEAGGAERDEGKGSLTFRKSAPASGTVKVSFVYQLKRPKGYRVHQ
ncbi:MAG TPA: DUF4139 domain-containing protein [Myxococcales bacterium]|nr:DUF4139 domain-containing protein [Myxococcales bacterium]